MRRTLLFFLLSALAACQSVSPFAFDPDAEEGVHGGVTVEWWYHFGWLTDDTGKEWAHFSSFFRAQRSTGPVGRYLIYDLTDLATGKKDFHSLVGEESPKPLKALGLRAIPPPHRVIPGSPLENSGDPLRLTYGDAVFRKTGHRTYHLKIGKVDLTLRATSEPMAVEGTGLTGIKQPDDMHYYTIPRLEATGTVNGRRAKGIMWYDHQWGSSWVEPTIGWSWWGLQLDDDTDVNAYVLRNIETGEILKATFTRDSQLYPLKATPFRSWTGKSKREYPIAWDLEGAGLNLRVEPLFDNREVPILGTLRAIWEGPVKVTGSVTGRGYQELVGYASVTGR